MPLDAGVLIVPAAMLSLNSIFALLGKIYNYVVEKWDELIYYRVIVDAELNPRLKRSIIEEIKSKGLHLNAATISMVDAGRDVDVDVRIGKYEYEDHIAGKVIIEVKDKEIAVKIPKLGNEKTIIKQIVRTIYLTHNQFSKVMMFYISDGDKWIRPIIRQPRSFNNIRLTNVMETVLADFSWFISPSGIDYYRNMGHPYRRGYFLYGTTGTGKSAMVEIISNRFEMPIYMVNLNSKDMTDNILVNLCGIVPPRSIILIDEIDKQLETIRTNKRISLSTGGLLMAIDGPQRLSEGTIVILTSNRFEILPSEEQKSLLRPGRIDRYFDFTA